MVPMNASGAAAAAAAEAARQREEEEEMTSYPRLNPAEWEFKILRSATSTFRTPEKLRMALAEEAHAGWTLLEKFDDSRIRLKRPIFARQNDHQLDFDPYRIWTGMTPNNLAFIILGIILVIMIFGLTLILTFAKPR